MWSDGSAVDFKFWDAGDPDDNKGAEDCGHNNTGKEFKWNDIQCHQTMPFICASRTGCPLKIRRLCHIHL